MLENLAKHFWTLNLVALALVAYLVASGASELIAAEIDDLIPPAGGGDAAGPSFDRAPEGPSWATSRRIDGMPILTRNIFDSKVGPLDPDFEAAPEIEEEEEDGGVLPLVDCASLDDVDVDLKSTVVSDADPRWSFASVSHDRESYLCRVGDDVDGRTVSHITWRYIFLRGDEDECYVDLLDEPKKKSRRRSRRRGKRLSRKEIRKGIEVVGPTERIVDRELIDRAFANPGKFARSMRVRPHKRNGEVDGFRIRRVKRNSPLYLLGARRGDIVHSVNGVDLTSVDKALAAYQSLRNDDRLVFRITRKGRPEDLEINIH